MNKIIVFLEIYMQFLCQVKKIDKYGGIGDFFLYVLSFFRENDV
jgi:hypothetical protein